MTCGIWDMLCYVRYGILDKQNLGNLVRIVVQIAHHEVIFLGDDVTSNQDVGGQALGADVLQQDRGLPVCHHIRSPIQRTLFITYIMYEDIGTSLKLHQGLLLYCCIDQGLT